MLPARLLVLAGLSLVVGAVVSRNFAPNMPGSSQRRLVQVVVALYLVPSAGLTILAPTLMLTLVNTAYYGCTQFLPAFLGVFFVRRFTAAGIAAGLIVGDVSVLALYGLGVSLGGVNIGLVALLINLAVVFAVSAATKSAPLSAPIAASREPGNPGTEGSTA